MNDEMAAEQMREWKAAGVQLLPGTAEDDYATFVGRGWDRQKMDSTFSLPFFLINRGCASRPWTGSSSSASSAGDRW